MDNFMFKSGSTLLIVGNFYKGVDNLFIYLRLSYLICLLFKKIICENKAHYYMFLTKA